WRARPTSAGCSAGGRAARWPSAWRERPMALSADRGASWSHALARGGSDGGSSELTAILAGSPPGVLSLAGGFPNARTFATGVIDEIAARVVREDAAVALQYT